MADYTDVQNVLVSLCSAAIYPNGTGQASVTGIPTLIIPGWPNAQQLDIDLEALNAGTGGRITVSVYATNVERNSTRYGQLVPTITMMPVTITATISANTITLAGTITVPQTVMININAAPYAYAVQAGDTLATIASALAALVTGATSSGAVVTVPMSSRIVWARVGGMATAATEVARQTRLFQITTWANNPAARASTSIAIDVALKSMPFITMSDGTTGRMIYRGSPQTDVTQKAAVYRRDLNYEVEFATTAISQVVTTLAAVTNLSPRTALGDVGLSQTLTR